MTSAAPAQAPLTRREREKLAHRREILEAAERLFVRKGVLSSTMEEVAREAEFSVGAIYTFFANKDELIAQVIENIIQDFRAAFDADVAGNPDPVEALEALIALRLRHVERHGKFFRLLAEPHPAGRIVPERTMPERCRVAYDDYLRRVAALFDRAVTAGQIRDVDPLQAALSLEGTLNAFVAFWERQNMTVPLRRQAEMIKDNTLRRVLAVRKRKTS